MSTVSHLTATIHSFGCVPPAARVFPVREPVKGPGGAWQAAIWLIGFKEIRAVLIPLDGNDPVAHEMVWSDTKQAVEAAMDLVHLVAEVELEEVV